MTWMAALLTNWRANLAPPYRQLLFLLAQDKNKDQVTLLF